MIRLSIAALLLSVLFSNPALGQGLVGAPAPEAPEVIERRRQAEDAAANPGRTKPETQLKQALPPPTPDKLDTIPIGRQTEASRIYPTDPAPSEEIMGLHRAVFCAILCLYGAFAVLVGAVAMRMWMLRHPPKPVITIAPDDDSLASRRRHTGSRPVISRAPSPSDQPAAENIDSWISRAMLYGKIHHAYVNVSANPIAGVKQNHLDECGRALDKLADFVKHTGAARPLPEGFDRELSRALRSFKFAVGECDPADPRIEILKKSYPDLFGDA
jgi:hypothetical protein